MHKIEEEKKSINPRFYLDVLLGHFVDSIVYIVLIVLSLPIFWIIDFLFDDFSVYVKCGYILWMSAWIITREIKSAIEYLGNQMYGVSVSVRSLAIQKEVNRMHEMEEKNNEQLKFIIESAPVRVESYVSMVEASDQGLNLKAKIKEGEK